MSRIIRYSFCKHDRNIADSPLCSCIQYNKLTAVTPPSARDDSPMSPLQNRPSQPGKAAAARPTPIDESVTTAPTPAAETSVESSESPEVTPVETPPLAQRPLIRPVARPELPKTPPTPPTPIAPPAAAAPPVSPVPPSVAAAPAPVVDEESGEAILRMQPIPAPSEPMQYRAIGLLRGRYAPSDEQFTRGTMTTTDGTSIEAVLLGRVMSLVKNHLELEQDHLFVVYPRTREKEQDLHAQIVGVWEPEKLNKEDTTEEEAETAATKVSYQPASEVDDDYFSIRGEIVFHDPDAKSVVVKIQQAPRKKDDNKVRAFKLQLEGVLTGKVVGYFWDLQVRRIGNGLVIQSGSAVAMIPPKKKPKMGFRGNRPGGGRRDFARPSGGFNGSKPGAAVGAPAAPKRDVPLPKPVKRQEKEMSSEA
jgi:hypothetical protein